LSSRFALTKWYLDVIADDGETAIVYAAHLRVSGLELHYASLLHCDAHGVRNRTALERAAPEISSTIRFAAPGLDVAGIWTPIAEPVGETLLSRDDGTLDWQCIAPRARVELGIDGRTFAGLGYVERVTMTIPPWQLPIRELRWGRVLTERDALVWIDWQGPTMIHRAWRNGARVDPIVVDDHGIDGLVRFENNRVLRQGTIGTTALSMLGRTLRDRVPASALLLDETKWRAEVTLDGARGSAIHEVVRWP